MSSHPTVFKGNVHIQPNVDSAAFGDGSLTVEGDLLVKGVRSEHQVDIMVIEDNLTALNEPPQTPGRDGGIIISRHIDDFTTGPVAESGTAQGGSFTNITLDASANAADNYYNNWYIKITAGPAVGEIKEITDYIGATKIATVDTSWTVVPTAASTYELYNKLRVVAMFDESEKEFAIVATTDDHTVDVVDIKGYCNLHVGKIIQGVAEECIYYVGMHGNDSDSGFHIMEAKLTFTAALAAAAAESPDAVNQIAIVCVDGCDYEENISIPSWVHVFAPNAKLSGTIIVANNSSVKFREQEISAGTAMTKSDADGFAEATIEIMTLTSTANGIDNSGSNSKLKFTNKKLEVEDGIAITNSATGTGSVTAILCDIEITGTGTAIQVAASATVNARVAQITESGTGMALDVGGILNAHIGRIDTTTAYSIAATGINNMFIGEINGTETVAGGGTSNRIYSGALTSKGDLLTRTTAEYIRQPVGTDSYILQADSTLTTGLKWVDPMTVIAASSKASHSLVSSEISVNTTTLTQIAYFDWDNAEYGSSTSGKIFFNLVKSNRDLEIQVYNETTAASLGSVVFTTSGFKNLSFTLPVADAVLSIRVSKQMGGGTNPEIYGLQLVLNPTS